MALTIEELRQERDSLKDKLRDLEVEQRAAETALKEVRQRELRLKREIDALSTLIDLRVPTPE